jgi:hypothetical protein
MNTAALLIVIALMVGTIAALLAGFLTWMSGKNAAKALLAAGAGFTTGTTATVTIMASAGAFAAQG